MQFVTFTVLTLQALATSVDDSTNTPTSTEIVDSTEETREN